ncbi:hypothetical protein [Chryseobacterium sp. HMWF035]|uniref:hypothetical protein n=1 Tax=Chryseobacterium sp. HMWF035 TaxID=2056868 RepID=UPI000D57B2B5|nr:hypothetical protein [Chryseobacterium sp. HMWF035]PVV56291.1 hypothetical protein DD829_11405 [Chryseobacterium sp. HMWF035]
MVKPIKTEKQYEEYIERIYVLLQKDIKANSKESNELEVLSILVKKHEEKYYPIEKPKSL